jgi:hypothetical protein
MVLLSNAEYTCAGRYLLQKEGAAEEDDASEDKAEGGADG